jgi:tetratricopeptide (TPR) repeat protein
MIVTMALAIAVAALQSNAPVPSGDAPVARNAAICKIVLPPVTSENSPNGRIRFDEAAVFERVVKYLEKKRYVEASRVYRYYFVPVYGDGFSSSENYFVKGQTRFALIAIYQQNFCSDWSSFSPYFYDANAVAPFEKALEEGIRGDYAAARADDELAYSRDPQFADPDLVSGMLCEARGDRANARKYWLRAAENFGVALPDTDINPARFAPVQLLLRFRP